MSRNENTALMASIPLLIITSLPSGQCQTAVSNQNTALTVRHRSWWDWTQPSLPLCGTSAIHGHLRCGRIQLVPLVRCRVLDCFDKRGLDYLHQGLPVVSVAKIVHRRMNRCLPLFRCQTALSLLHLLYDSTTIFSAEEYERHESHVTRNRMQEPIRCDLGRRH